MNSSPGSNVSSALIRRLEIVVHTNLPLPLPV